MNRLLNHIASILSTLVLIGVLMLPTAVQFTHLFEHHEHRVCTISSVHLHEKEVDCSILHFKFSSYDYTFTSFTITKWENNWPQSFVFNEIQYEKETPRLFHLRAPPTIG
ncbi:hypothetical protein [Luteirhabdus pelagi]|uniref:hypothetical protein n=1 Tax=Luteirhabdus pelagi TaxID=2792783 RepID=UPI00193AAD54|nr:hypothetical protein [Luteirhabdus pelagi]